MRVTTIDEALRAVQQFVAGPLGAQALGDPPFDVVFQYAGKRICIRFSGNFMASPSGLPPHVQVVVDHYTYLYRTADGFEWGRVGAQPRPPGASTLQFETGAELEALLTQIAGELRGFSHK